jgi:hypothetical protein
MTYTARHSVQDSILRRMKKIEKRKVQVATTANMEAILEDVIEKFNIRYVGLSTPESKYLALEDLQTKLGAITHPIDNDVAVCVNWYKNEIDDLILQSITIEWSEAARVKYNLPVQQNINLCNKSLRELLGG